MSGLSRVVRRRLAVVAALLLAIPAWYLAVRILSPWNAVTVLELEVNAADATPGFKTLRVGCYNIAHGRGGLEDVSNWNGEPGDVRLDRLLAIAGQIRRFNLDVVILNECDFDCNWSRRLDQARVIAEAAGFPFVVEQRNYDFAAPFFSWRFGNAILSRMPIAQSERIRFEPRSKREALMAGNHDGLLCRLAMPDGQEVAVLAVHLESRPPEDARTQAADRLLGIERGLGIPLIAAGDFNSSPSGFPLAMKAADGRNAMDELLGKGRFHSAASVEPAAGEFTFPSASPDRKLDWILASEWLEIRRLETVESDLSDHLMIWAEVGMPTGGRP